MLHGGIQQAVTFPTDWKTYVNSSGGYEIKYPSKFNIYEVPKSDYLNQTQFNLVTPGSGNFPNGLINLSFSIDVRKKDAWTIDSLLKLRENTSSPNFDVSLRKTNINIDGIHGRKNTYDSSSKKISDSRIFSEAYVVKGNLIYGYMCSYQYKFPEGIKKDINITQDIAQYDCSTLDKMLASFKFLK